MRYYAVLCGVMRCYAELCGVMRCYAVLCGVMRCYADLIFHKVTSGWAPGTTGYRRSGAADTSDFYPYTAEKQVG